MENTSLNSNSNNISMTTLLEWCGKHNKEEEMRSVFLNMDRTLKYIHEHGYCIESFSPTDIYILNDKDDYIQFRKLVELSSDLEIRKKMIQEDIFKSSIIQLSMYGNISLNTLNIDFLKENFDSFTIFLPNDDVAYYRGVIQRGASVYFCEFALEKRKRDLEMLSQEVGNVSEEEKEKVNAPVTDDELTNKKVNDLIYRQINGLRDAAFINLLIVPLVMVGILIVFIITTLILNFIG